MMPLKDSLSVVVALPADFRADEVLAFHRRDPAGTAERVEDGVVAKGLCWRGGPAALTLRPRPGTVEAVLAVDGEVGAQDGAQESALAAMARRMLGLGQRVAPFVQAFGDHPQLGPLLALRPGLRVPQTATPFEALAWAIIGQQITVTAAVSIRARLIRQVGVRHSGGLWCFPDAPALARQTPETLRGAGLSAAKAQALIGVAERAADGALPLDEWAADPVPADTIRETLLAIRGVGPWTVEYVLLRGYGWLDGSLDGDAAVRRAIARLTGKTVTAAEARSWLAPFAPWRALAAAHLWASLSTQA